MVGLGRGHGLVVLRPGPLTCFFSWGDDAVPPPTQSWQEDVCNMPEGWRDFHPSNPVVRNPLFNAGAAGSIPDCEQRSHRLWGS